MKELNHLCGLCGERVAVTFCKWSKDEFVVMGIVKDNNNTSG